MPANNANKVVDLYAPTHWGKDDEDLTCPSGQRCLVRRPDIMKLLSDGTLTKTDMLTQLMDDKHVSRKAKGGKNSDKANAMKTEILLKQALGDPEKMQDLIAVMNSVVMATVIKPELHAEPKDGEDRIPGRVYIDTVEPDDKAFLMNFAFGGTRGVARFRGELSERIERMESGEDFQETSQ